MEENIKKIKSMIRDVADFPKKGINSFPKYTGGKHNSASAVTFPFFIFTFIDSV